MQPSSPIVADLEDCLHKIASQVPRIHLTGDAEFECYLRQQLELLTQEKQRLLGHTEAQSPQRFPRLPPQQLSPVKHPLRTTQVVPPQTRKVLPTLLFPKLQKSDFPLAARRYAKPKPEQTAVLQPSRTFALGRTRVYQHRSFSVPTEGTNPFLA